eukprot:TRINITY_DN46818_c0_g1_i1.p1 TRINITY_DN46818_c0_g1~~TRINITY_DN46818_c0_g1_i1.p1  ORF type:complete len:502 (+),score=171.34 TRINITY_DN46818_c0_g1_i1:72-1577(+)
MCSIIGGGIMVAVFVAASLLASPVPKSAEERVLVVGGGFAGLIAARNLREAGVAVEVVEGRHRVGGRVWTDERWGAPVDVCATFVHGVDNNPVAREAARYSIPIEEVNYAAVRVYGGSGAEVDPAVVSRTKQVYRKLRKRVFAARDTMTGDTDLRTAFQRAYRQLNLSLTDTEKESLSWHFYWEIVQDQVAQLRELSVVEFDASVMYEGRDAVVVGGMQRLVDAVAEGTPARVNSTVVQIEHTPHGVAVELAGGEVLRGTRAVVALPLGVLQQGLVSFRPPLPRWKRRAVQRLGCSATFKMALRFPHRFWPADAQFMGKIGSVTDEWGEGEHMEFINMEATAHRAPNVLVVEVEGDFARSFARMTPAQRSERVMKELRLVFGDAAVDPVDTLSANYVSDALVGGCGFSFWPPLASGDDNLEAAESVSKRLFFAGEHTTPVDYGNLHGAINEGARVAAEVASVLATETGLSGMLAQAAAWIRGEGRRRRKHFVPPWCPAPCQ